MSPTFSQLVNSEAAAWGLVKAHKQTIATLERELAEAKTREGRKDSLLQECRGHLKGWKMSMLASTPERLLAKIEAELKSKGNASESS